MARGADGRTPADGNAAVAQAHAQIAIAEGIRGLHAPTLWTPAHELRVDQVLADGSIVAGVDESFEEPNLVYVRVIRADRIYSLALLRTTPIGVAKAAT